MKDVPTETAAEDVEEAANDPEQVNEAPVTDTNKRSVIIAEEQNLEIETEACCEPIKEEESQIDEIADMAELPVPSMTTKVQEDDASEEGKEEEEFKLIEKGSVNAMAKILSKQFFWTSIATISFVFGIGLLVVSREVVEKDFKSRRWSRR